MRERLTLDAILADHIKFEHFKAICLDEAIVIEKLHSPRAKKGGKGDDGVFIGLRVTDVFGAENERDSAQSPDGRTDGLHIGLLVF